MRPRSGIRSRWPRPSSSTWRNGFRKRLDKPLKVPDLSAQGYALVGGRLLPGSEGARAQFMFERAGGERVTLYIGSLGAGRGRRRGRARPRSASRPTGPVPSFYWVDRGFGYALAGALPRDALLASPPRCTVSLKEPRR